MKTIKSRGGDVVLVVGEELKVSQNLDLEGRVVVGKFFSIIMPS
jgi:hypothetical protein